MTDEHFLRESTVPKMLNLFLWNAQQHIINQWPDARNPGNPEHIREAVRILDACRTLIALTT